MYFESEPTSRWTFFLPNVWQFALILWLVLIFLQPVLYTFYEYQATLLQNETWK